jgi:hypothetical protein
LRVDFEGVEGLALQGAAVDADVDLERWRNGKRERKKC